MARVLQLVATQDDEPLDDPEASPETETLGGLQDRRPQSAGAQLANALSNLPIGGGGGAQGHSLAGLDYVDDVVIGGWERVAGSGACPVCADANGDVVSAPEFFPFHEHCDCSLMPRQPDELASHRLQAVEMETDPELGMRLATLTGLERPNAQQRQAVESVALERLRPGDRLLLPSAEGRAEVEVGGVRRGPTIWSMTPPPALLGHDWRALPLSDPRGRLWELDRRVAGTAQVTRLTAGAASGEVEVKTRVELLNQGDTIRLIGARGPAANGAVERVEVLHDGRTTVWVRSGDEVSSRKWVRQPDGSYRATYPRGANVYVVVGGGVKPPLAVRPPDRLPSSLKSPPPECADAIEALRAAKGTVRDWSDAVNVGTAVNRFVEDSPQLKALAGQRDAARAEVDALRRRRSEMGISPIDRWKQKWNYDVRWRAATHGRWSGSSYTPTVPPDPAQARRLEQDLARAERRLAEEQRRWREEWDSLSAKRAEVDARIERLQRAWLDEHRARVLDVLGQVREMGLSGDLVELRALDRTAGGKALRQLNDNIARFVPTDWLRRGSRRDVERLTIQRAKLPANVGGTYSELFHAITLAYGPMKDKVLLHEYLHHMEAVNPHLRQLEESFYRHRTTGEAKRAYAGMAGHEYRPDGFVDDYMGTDYGDGYWELITRGWSEGFAFNTPYSSFNTADDEAMFLWLLGVLAAA